MTILQQTHKVLNGVDWDLGKDISINKCWHVTDGYERYLRMTGCVQDIHTTYFFTDFLATEFLSKSLRNHMLSVGHCPPPQKVFLEESGKSFKKSTNRMLLLINRVQDWSGQLAKKNIYIYICNVLCLFFLVCLCWYSFSLHAYELSKYANKTSIHNVLQLKSQ